jgi:hypothetical protein
MTSAILQSDLVWMINYMTNIVTNTPRKLCREGSQIIRKSQRRGRKWAWKGPEKELGLILVAWW